MISLATLINNHVMDNPFSFLVCFYAHQFIIHSSLLIFGFVCKTLTIIEVGIVLSLFFRFPLAKTICWHSSILLKFINLHLQFILSVVVDRYTAGAGNAERCAFLIAALSLRSIRWYPCYYCPTSCLTRVDLKFMAHSLTISWCTIGTQVFLECLFTWSVWRGLKHLSAIYTYRYIIVL